MDYLKYYEKEKSGEYIQFTTIQGKESTMSILSTDNDNNPILKNYKMLVDMWLIDEWKFYWSIYIWKHINKSYTANTLIEIVNILEKVASEVSALDEQRFMEIYLDYKATSEKWKQIIEDYKKENRKINIEWTIRDFIVEFRRKFGL